MENVRKNNTIRPVRSYATTQARTALPEIINQMVEVTEAAASLAEHAVEVGPRNRGGVWIVPAIDVEAAMDREESLQARVAELEDEAENIAIALMLSERLASSAGATVSAEEFVRGLGFEDLAQELAD